jgi:hypothetical protein
MRSAPALLAVLLAIPAWTADFSGVRNVYLFPMASGLDQYLANHLTSTGVFQVVTDPQRAEAVFTDQIGQALELRFAELFPPPAPQPPEPAEGEDRAGKSEEDGGEAAAGDCGDSAERPKASSFRRGQGNVFLVHRESRVVLWSAHHRPKNTTAREMDKAAAKIVSLLQESLGGRP